ncbi:MAG TPA: DUF1643 domain-containing protein [Leptospiraceae bacterium]|nr:DUF1643 domain-containing protein [Leptospiraceae bacterium]HMX31811.1 DUF1643 domain-containing protein [Leptospiraceae bacterium]HMY32546.1 DUF1643 domain-containing protein [Leptospiraceae bacterium]HNA06875.1 DUF1643 domain-containing protein [Leptospiraceae bacterium]HNE10158.1 DUF1643 domain-containing protein [Leptospiraceae bacterium]
MKSNWIYSNTQGNKARFLLGEKGNKTLVCIGINPSIAEPEKLDNTLKVVKRFSKDLGYDSWLMLNVYPQRATNPNELDFEINMDYHRENLFQINKILKHGNYDIWAAWGTIIKKRKYLVSCLKDIYMITRKYSLKWNKIGRLSKEGHPHHPLYLNRNLKLEQFDIDNYLNRLV